MHGHQRQRRQLDAGAERKHAQVGLALGHRLLQGMAVIASKENRDQSELAPEFAGRIADIDPAVAGTASDAGGKQKLKSDHCVLKMGW